MKTIYEDNDVLVVDKPAGLDILGLINILIEQNPELKNVGEAPRYGIVHRLDKDTSGILLVAKSSEALKFFQNRFINREVEKKYTALATGVIKQDSGEIKNLIARSKGDPRKQVVSEVGREAISQYKVLERFEKYTLLEVKILTGRKHQIRCHLAYIHHPVAGDQLYGFKDSPCPAGLNRQFLHANYLKIKLLNGKEKEFHSDLPEDLKEVLKTCQNY